MTPAGFARLKLDEGLRLVVYNDHDGLPIRQGKEISGNPTIGYGRNLASRGITPEEAEMLLQNDVANLWAILIKRSPWIIQLPPVWADVVLMVEYNTGDVWEFPMMLQAMQNRETDDAKSCLLDSAAARELPERYGRMAAAIVSQRW